MNAELHSMPQTPAKFDYTQFIIPAVIGVGLIYFISRKSPENEEKSENSEKEDKNATTKRKRGSESKSAAKK